MAMFDSGIFDAAVFDTVDIPAGRWVSQTGNNANPGTYALPYATIQYGWSQCAAGETLWVKDDLTPTSFSSASTGIILTANGTAGNPITLRGWPAGTRRVINLTNHTHDPGNYGTGIRVVANYAVLRDLHITEVKAPLRTAPYIDAVNWRGTNGQFLNCEISQVEGRGLTISESGLATNLLVQNCDIHDCFDPRSASPYGDADGIQVFNATSGVIIEKCRIWRCADDGIDMFFQTQPVTIRDNWIWKTGYREDGTTSGGDGTGIKTGSATRGANHIIERNLIFDCRVWGIGGNDTTVANTWSYNTVIDCPTAYESFTAGVAHVLSGNLKYGGTNSFTGSEVRTRNSFDTPPGITESAAWFVSLSRTGVDAARGVNGLLPTITFAQPTSGSALVGAGPSGNTIGAFAAASGGLVTLSPPLLDEGDTFFSATVVRGAISLAPPLVSDADTFFAATIVRGAVTLAPPLLSDADVIFSATVLPGLVSLAPPLLTDGDTFFAATLVRGAVTLAPPFVDEGDTFYSATIVQAGAGAQTLSPPLVSEADVFFGATVLPGVVTLAPGLLTDPDAFFAATIQRGAVTVGPPLLIDADVFFAATVIPGARTLVAPFISDPDTFFTATVVRGSVSLAPPLFVEPDTFFGATVLRGTVVLLAPLVDEGDVFFPVTVTVVVPSPTAPDRIVMPPREPRIARFAAESRISAPARERRTVAIAADTRVVTVERLNRIVFAQKETGT